MDHVIHRNNIVNRRFFIYCSLACAVISKLTLASGGLLDHRVSLTSFTGALLWLFCCFVCRCLIRLMICGQTQSHTRTHTTHTLRHTHTHTHIHTHTHTHTHIHTRTHAHTRTRTRTDTHTDTQTHRRSRARTHTPTPTHTHTHASPTCCQVAVVSFAIWIRSNFSPKRLRSVQTYR